MRRFDGQTAIVTGGARGIGLGITRRLMQEGCRVAVWDLDAAGCVAALAQVVDVADLAAVECAFAAAVAALGKIDILVNNAGVNGPVVPAWEYPPEAWARVLAIDLTGVFNCCRAVIPHMRDRDYGRIVNIASIAGKEGMPGISAYSAAKAGVIGFTKAVARELAQTGVTVNAVAPVIVETELFREMTQEHIESAKARIPTGRFLTVPEIAAQVAWIASRESSFTTGAVFDLSGGRAHVLMKTTVLVVGAGPVGLSLAMDLAWRGVEVTVVEMRHRGEPPNVKCNHVAARSMEIFRRLGVARALRNTGLPADYPNDAAFRTTTTGIEFGRIPIPCRADRYTATGGPDTWWPTAEPPHRINQLFLEPVLFAHAASMVGISILNRTRLADFDQSPDQVTAVVENLDDGTRTEISCTYMVGCDGARSEVRRAIGANFSGDAVVQRTQSSYIRAPALLSLLRSPPAWANFSYNPRRSGNMFAIDGRETWLIHNYLRAGETDFDAVDRDLCIRQILGVGPEFSYEIISKEDWIGRRMIADRFRDRRVFICGDAAHIWVPFAGYGMNAGIADATNLSWMLAAVLQGWGAPDLLAAHEAERLPITEQVSHYAMGTSLALARQRAAVPEDIEARGPEGDAMRARFGEEAYRINVAQLCCGGLNFGSFYEASPIICYDGEAAPPYTLYDFTPSTVPGCRTPHFFLRDGRSVYDAMGPGYTLLRFDPAADAAAIVAAAAKRCVPLVVLDVGCDLYRHKLVLSRPDQHVAWRGDAAPDDPLALIDLIRGACAA